MSWLFDRRDKEITGVSLHIPLLQEVPFAFEGLSCYMVEIGQGRALGSRWLMRTCSGGAFNGGGPRVLEVPVWPRVTLEHNNV